MHQLILEVKKCHGKNRVKIVMPLKIKIAMAKKSKTLMSLVLAGQIGPFR